MEKFWTKEQFWAFIRENGPTSAEDAQQALKELVQRHAPGDAGSRTGDRSGLCKIEKTGKAVENRRYGHSSKMVRSEFGKMDLSVPLDRNGTFELAVVKKHQNT